MARGFNLTAQINLRGPSNMRPIIQDIRRQLGSINANVNLNINANTVSSINRVNNYLNRLNTTLATTTATVTSAAQAFNNLATAMASVSSRPMAAPTNIPRPPSVATNSATPDISSGPRTEFEDFGRQAGLAVRRFAAFASVTSVIYSFTNALSAATNQYIEFDKQITRLSQVTNESKASLASVTSEITRLSVGMGVASEDLAQVSVTLAQAGFSAAETRKALEALAKSALAPSFDDLNQTVEGSIALMRQFGISANQLEGALGSINAVAAGFAVEASDLISAIQRTGGVFASASKGVSEGTDSLNEFLAIFTSIRATTRESAETIATGLRTIFTRIQRADTIEALKEYGVVLTDLEGKFVGPYMAVQKLAEGLGRIDPRDLRFSEIVEELGGFRQIGKVLPLIQQFSTAQEALKVAQAGQGSLATDAAKGQLALAIQIQKVREEFTALVRSIGNSDGFQTMIRLGLDLASALIKIADATKGILPLIGIMAAFRGVSAIAQFTSGFGGGLRGGNARRASNGGLMDGPVYRFSSGGIVPGSGKGDKVPALLEPGEVVMSNSAGNKYGRGNLVRMNRYVSGGKADKNKSGEKIQNFVRGGTVWSGLPWKNPRGIYTRISPRGIVPLVSSPAGGITQATEPDQQTAAPSSQPRSASTYGYEFTHLDAGFNKPTLTKNDRRSGIALSNLGIMLPRTMNQIFSSGPNPLDPDTADLLDRYITSKGWNGSAINPSGGAVPRGDVITEIVSQTPAELFGSFLGARMPIPPPGSTLAATKKVGVLNRPINRRNVSSLPPYIQTAFNLNEFQGSVGSSTFGEYDEWSSSAPGRGGSGTSIGGAEKSSIANPAIKQRLKDGVLSVASRLPLWISNDVELLPLGEGLATAAATIVNGKELAPEMFQIRDIQYGRRRPRWGRADVAQPPSRKNPRFIGRGITDLSRIRGIGPGHQDFPYRGFTARAGGKIQKFAKAGKVEPFGTGETTFPPRIKKTYRKEKEIADSNARAKLAWDLYPNNERITVDDSQVQEAFQQPFDRAKFTESFNQKISRDSLFSRMADFAKFIGLPQEDLTRVLPLQLDFGGPGMGLFASASFQKGARGSRPYEGYDLSRFGYGEAQKQEAYGLEKLIEAKQKEIKKIQKTPLRTFDDGSFSIDNVAYSKANDELRALQAKKYQLADLKSKAQKTILDEQEKISDSTGRGTVSFAPSLGRTPDNKNAVMYHELTHQLFKGLKAKQSDSFDKYREKVNSLFAGDNDYLADAFDALATGPDGGYTSADVVYGRRYKMNELLEMDMSANRRNSSSIDLGKPQAVQRETITDLMRLRGDAEKATKAREFKPLNPIINKTLLETQNTGRVFDQSYIDALEDSGKEEFLTTLVEKSPQLDSNLQKVLDDTLTNLLGSAGIKRQSYATGGVVQKFIDGGWVERMKKQTDATLRTELSLLDGASLLLETGDRKVGVSTFNTPITMEDIGKRELNQRYKAIEEYLQERKSTKKKKFANRRGTGLTSTEQYNEQEMLDAISLYQAGSGPFTKALISGKGKFKDPRGGQYETQDINDRLLAASQFDIPKKTYSGLGRSQLKEILNDTGITPKSLAKSPDSIKSLVGKTIDFPTFLSVSASKPQAEAFVQNPGALLSIDGGSTSQKTIDVVKAKNKTKIAATEQKNSRRLAGLEKINQKKLDVYDEEQEFIIPPNVGFKIIRASGKVGGTFAEDLKAKKTKTEDDFLAAYFDEDDDYIEKTKLNLQAQMLRSGGAVQRFVDGGVAQRKVGYIDYDVIANEANKNIVEKGMESTGMKGPRLYTDHLTQLAVQARKDSNLQKLRAVYGVAGSGKTTLARGQGTDNATLRQTERFPILSPDDIKKATEVIVLSSSVSKDKLDDVFSATDRTYTLSSTTKAEKDIVRLQRVIRDESGVGLEGRKPGSTSGVATDTAVGEALLSDRLGDRSVVLGRLASGKLRRKQGNELVEIVKKKIGFTWGGFAPMTAGHESIMDAAAAMGISPEDFIYLVGSNEGVKPGDPSSYRTAVFDQDTRMVLARAGAGAKGATVLPKPRDFEVPQAFDITEEGSDRRKVLLPKKGSRAFVADKTPEQTKKYKDAGYSVTNLERTGGISGTMVRDLIMSGDMGKLQEVLSPGVYDIISNNIGRLQNRANILPDIIEQVRANQGVKLADVEKEIKALGISRIDNKKVAIDPEYAAKVEVLQELRDKRDKIKSAASFEPYRLLDDLARSQPEKYGLDLSTDTIDPRPIRTVTGNRPQKASIGGLIQKFNGGSTDGVFYHGSGDAINKIDPDKLGTRGVNMLGAGFNVALSEETARIYEEMARRKYKQNHDGTTRGFPGGTYPVSIKGGIDNFPEANEILSGKTLQSMRKVYKQAGISDSGMDWKTATFRFALDDVTARLADRIEPKLRKKKDVKDPGYEAIRIASQQVRELMVANGISGAKNIAGRDLEDQMAVVYDPDIVEIGKPLKRKFLGGPIQRFMAGSVGGVKSKTGRKSAIPMAEKTLQEMRSMPVGYVLDDILGGPFAAVQAAGVAVSALKIRKIMKQKKARTSEEEQAVDEIYRTALKIYNDQAAANRGQATASTAQAVSQGLLFGAVGMFGNPFPAENVTLTEKDGLKKSTDVRVFGAALDIDQAARDARLEKEQKLAYFSRMSGLIENKRAQPKGAGAESRWRRDTFVSDIAAAPIASVMDQEHRETYIKGITEKHNKAQLERVRNALTGGKTKVGIDFDETLAYNTDPKGYIRNETGEPDYALFGDETAVREGLFKNPARPSPLLMGIVDLVKTTASKMPDQLPALLDSIHVVTARPSGAVKPIHEWLASQGLSLPLDNVKGVGGEGVKDVAVEKAKKMLALGPPDRLLFVDDHEDNNKAMIEAGISSLSYGSKLPIDRATSKNIADSQGSEFESYLKLTLKNINPKLYDAMLQESDVHQSIDFPYGLGTKIANGWFGNPLLADIPVDAKRTLDGPRGAIKENIINYLKAKGYNDGGIVQRFEGGSEDGVKGIQLGKGRGKKGPRGSYGPRGFKILDDQEYESLRQQAYEDAGEYGGPGWDMEHKPPMPKVLAKYNNDLWAHIFTGIDIPVAKPFDPKIDKTPQYMTTELLPFRYPKATKERKIDPKEILKAAEAKQAAYTSAEASISEFKETGTLSLSPSIMDYLSRGISNPDGLPLDKDDIESIKKKLTKTNLEAFELLVGPDKVPVGVQGQRTKLSEVFGAILETYGSDVSSLELGNITRAMGEKLSLGGLVSLREGGSVQRFGGYKLGGQIYDLQKGTGLSDQEFNELVKYGNTNDFNETEFRDYLANFLKNKQAKKDLRVNSEQLRQVLLSGTRTPSASQKQTDLARQLMGAPDAQYNPKDDKSRTLAEGGLAEAVPEMTSLMQGLYGNRNRQKKPQKNYGKIGLRSDGSAITATYFKNDQREGYVSAYKMRDYLYYVGLSKATQGYGPRLYDAVMEEATAKGAMLTADRSLVSGAAKRVWEYYFNNRSDVKKTPLKPDDWTRNQSMVDPKLYGKPETWPPSSDPAWVLQSGYSKSPSLINDPNSVVRMDQAPNSGSMAAQYFSRAMGGRLPSFASGGTVPALVSNGEAYVPPKLAKRIGYGTLNRMNQADRNGMGRFSEGGISVFRGPGSGTSDSIRTNLPVGSYILRAKATKALGFNRGGTVGVQRFFFGGRSRRAPEARPESININTIGASDQAIQALTLVSNAMIELGLRGSQSAVLLSRGYQATAAEAEKAYQADLLVARAAGANAQTLFDLERAIQRANAANQTEIALKQQLANVTGEQIEDFQNAARAEILALEARDTAAIRSSYTGTSPITDDQITEALREGAQARSREAYENVASSSTSPIAGIDLSAINASGEDLARVFTHLSRDSQTLQQMNNRYLQNRRNQLALEARANGDFAREARIRAGLQKDVENILQDEIRLRNNAINDSARTDGAQGPDSGQRRDRQENALLSFGVITVGNIIADNINAKSSAVAAGVSGAIRGGSQAFGYTNQINSELQNLADTLATTGSRFAGLAQKAASLAKGFQLAIIGVEIANQAYNAIRDFAIELEKKRIEIALEGLAEGFESLEKDINQPDLINGLKNQILEASEAADSQRKKTQDTTSSGFINFIDVFASDLQSLMEGNNAASRQSAVRGKVLEQDGVIEYFKTLMGGSEGIESVRSKVSADSGRESAALFKPIADNVNKLINSRIKAGESIEDLLGGPEFENFARTLVMADASLATQIRSIELNTLLTEDAKQARIAEIISISGASKIRNQAEITLREQTQKNFAALVSVYTRSLQRMFNNMEQAINATSFSLEKMKNNVDLTVSALQGQAKVGELNLNSKNILQNPTAYSDVDVQSAAAMGGSLFGNRSPEMTQMANLGETITGSVMSTINKTLREQGPDVTNETITRIIDNNLKSVLRDLGLPPELADKLAKEVGDTIVDIRKEGDDRVDYAKLSEKIASLGNVTDIAKQAQQSVIKALENYQNILNQYSSNINTIIDLEVSARDKSRKSISLLDQANIDLARSLGRSVSVVDIFNKRNSEISRQTGGLTDPNDIFNKILELNNTRSVQQESVRSAADQGFAGAKDFVKFNSELKNTNIALRENRAALEEMANNTEKASAAMSEIQEAQQKAANRIGFLEKVVGSTPDEFESLNNSMIRLQRNMSGQQNTIQQSVGAQKAYIEAINNGSDAAEAMRAAQTAFANERKETLGTLQDLMPFLGNNQQANNIRANVLETMARESGMGVSPVMEQILNSLRNPEQDPATAAAIQYYNQAITEQSAATRLLGRLDQTLANDIAQSNSKLIVDGLTKAVLTFQNSELKDIARDVNAVVAIVKDRPAAGAPAGLAQGGIVYAAGGQLVNFQPKGTDTVPAMLTPGEFVVNRKATQANLPLLNSINNGYAKGGKVSYYADGGYVTNWGDENKTLNLKQVSSKPIINPNIENNKKAWTTAKTEIRAIPGVYTTEFNSQALSIPNRNSYNLDSPLLRVSKIVPGYSDNIVQASGRPWKYIYQRDNDAFTEASTPKTLKAAGKLYFKDRLETQLKAPKNSATKIKEEIKTSFPGIETVRNIEQLDPNKFGGPPADPIFEQTANMIQTTAKTDKYPGAFYMEGDAAASSNEIPQENQIPGNIGIYDNNTWLDVFAGRPHAVTTLPNKPNFDGGPYYETLDSTQWKLKSGSRNFRFRMDTLPAISAENIQQKNEDNIALVQLIKNTQDFLNDRVEYISDGDDKLQTLLSGLFNGTLSVATLDSNVVGDMSIFDKLENVRSIVVAQDSLRNDFIVARNSIVANKDKAIVDGVKFGIPGEVEDAEKFTLAEGFKITKIDGAGGRNDKELPFMINGSIADYLGADFKAKADQEAVKQLTEGTIKTRLFSDNIKLDLPAGIMPEGLSNSIDIPILYKEYTGKLFDSVNKSFIGDEFKYLLPEKREKTLFQQLDTSTRRLFTNRKYNADILLGQSNIRDRIVVDSLNSLIKNQLNKNKIDYDIASEKLKTDLQLKFGPQSSLIKYMGASTLTEGRGQDIFSGLSGDPFSVSIGEFFIDKLKDLQSQAASQANKVDQTDPDLKKGVVFTEAEAKEATASLIMGSMRLFNGIPGLPSGWVAKNGGTRALRANSMGYYKDAASYMSSLFNQAGSFVDQLLQNPGSVRNFDSLSNAYTMISGASGAFGSIASGNSSLLKQFYAKKVNVEDVFRSYGLGAKFGKVSALELTGDWKNLLANQLQDSKLKTIGRSGNIEEISLSSALPENAKVSDLVKIIFNPYNEFSGNSNRKQLIQKFGDDLFNLRSPNTNLPYFDRRTLMWMKDGLTRLMDWYGGAGDWVGQDYFFDKNIEPDNSTRINNFIDSYNRAGENVYKKAQEAQVLFGLADQFGPLPSLDWFRSRSAQIGVENETQMLASGGVVYASTGKLINFQPRGTDTVPAMLTPGEFVVNRAATQRNLPLLQSINSGASATNGYSTGGVVYLSGGALVPDIGIEQEPDSPEINDQQYQQVIFKEWQKAVQYDIEDREEKRKLEYKKVDGGDWKIQPSLLNYDSEPILQYANQKVPGVSTYLKAIEDFKKGIVSPVLEQTQPIPGINIDDLTTYLSKQNDVLSIINPYVKESQLGVSSVFWTPTLGSMFGGETRQQQEKKLVQDDIASLSPKLDIWKDILDERLDENLQEERLKETIKNAPIGREGQNRINKLRQQQASWKKQKTEYEYRRDALEGMINLRELGGGSLRSVEKINEIRLKGEESVEAGQNVETTTKGGLFGLYGSPDTTSEFISFADIRNQGLREDVIDAGVREGTYKGLRNMAIGLAVGASLPILVPLGGMSLITALGASLFLGGGAALGAINYAEILENQEFEKLKDSSPEEYARVLSLRKDKGYQDTASTVEGWLDIADVAIGIGGGIAAHKLAKKSPFFKYVSMALGDTGEIGEKLRGALRPKKVKATAITPAGSKTKAKIHQAERKLQTADAQTKKPISTDDVQPRSVAAKTADDAAASGASRAVSSEAQTLRNLGVEQLDLEDFIRKADPRDAIPASVNQFAPIDYAKARLEALNNKIKSPSVVDIIEEDVIKQAQRNFIARGGWSDVPVEALPNRKILEEQLERLNRMRRNGPLSAADQARSDAIAARLSGDTKPGSQATTKKPPSADPLAGSTNRPQITDPSTRPIIGDSGKGRVSQLNDPMTSLNRYEFDFRERAADGTITRRKVYVDAANENAAKEILEDTVWKPQWDQPGMSPRDLGKTKVKKVKSGNEIIKNPQRAAQINEKVSSAQADFKTKMKSIEDDYVTRFYNGEGLPFKNDAEVLLRGITDDVQYRAAYKKAIAKNLSPEDAVKEGLRAVDGAKLDSTIAEMKAKGFDIGPDGNLQITDTGIKRVMDDPIYGSAYDTNKAKTRTQLIDEAAKDLNIKKPSKDYDDLVKIFDGDATLRDRSWRGFVKEKLFGTPETRTLKWWGSRGGLIAAIAAGFGAYVMRQNRAPEGQQNAEPVEVAGKPAVPIDDGGGAGGDAAGGGAVVMPPSFKEEAAAQQEAKKQTIKSPDYYDELSYKEYASQAIVEGNMPPPPDKSKFTTMAMYSRNNEGKGYRTTAYDQRSSAMDATVLGDAKGRPKGGAGTRTAASQIHTRTAAFSKDGTPRDASISDPNAEFANDRDTIDDILVAQRMAVQNYQYDETEGFTPVGVFGEKEIDGTLTQAQQNRAVKMQAQRGDKTIWGAKSIGSQYKSAYSWWRGRLGEYNYYNSVNWKNRDRWRLGFARSVNASGRGNARELEVKDPKAFYSGGIVYANNGMLIPYQPRGTDTVPAMLTPGEFVVNRQAAQQNLPLLKSINSGSYQTGGVVKYLSEGTEKETPEEKRARLAQIREEKKEADRKAYQQRKAAEDDRLRALQQQRTQLAESVQQQKDRMVAARAKPAQMRQEAMVISQAEGISKQEAMQRITSRDAPAQQQPQQQQAIPRISPQMQQRVGQAAQAAFNPENSGDVNKQLVIFGTLLTGVNQVLKQFGAVMQQLTAVGGGGVNNRGAQPQGGGLDGLGQFTAKFDQFIAQLNKLNLPPEININGNHKVDVVINGAQALQELLNGPLSNLIAQQVKSAFDALEANSEGTIRRSK